MPRTKGSKNKSKNVSFEVVDIDARILQTEEEIERLKENLKDKKEMLRILKQEKVEQDKQKIIDSILSTGNTPEQILTAIESPAFAQFLVDNIKTKEEAEEIPSKAEENDELEGIEADIIE